MGNCCTFFKSELNPCQEYYSSTDANGKKLDIEESFGPSSIYAILAKVAFAGFSIFTWISMFVDSDHKDFFLAYLTLWALSFQMVYHVFSVWNSLAPPPGINRRVKIHWFLFNLVAHMDIIVAILWWYTVYDPDESLTFNNVSPHSATAAVILMDGLLVNRIPIRIHHWWRAVLPIDIAYPVWTILHSVLDVGNPNESDNDPETNDDAIYTAVDWKDDVSGTAIFIVIVVVVVGPVVQCLIFVLSLYSPCCRVSRRYLDKGVEEEEREEISDAVDPFEASGMYGAQAY
uniref:Glycerophosphocholine acyltransferase 1 n=1 Tax=Amphora coffeiformis TaxID=265554 RepID=A0A7S3LIE5_9STRA|mmetsp:Transcript_10317/g.19795  ORF Transcript_10317/g.19795 Transcript_10317/m.19795 type:complete len:288 (+) Transcript_10317:70-933(+)|eukprot:scaffold6761_cov159-Amphora_coffeaeformis.AAC.12